MEGLKTTIIITCGVCSGYLLSFVVWNLIKRKYTRRIVDVKIEEDECSSVDTYTTMRSLFTDSGASFHLPVQGSHSIISSGSFVSACESLHDRFHTLDLLSNHNFRNYVIAGDFLFNGKSREDFEDGQKDNEDGQQDNEDGQQDNEDGQQDNEEYIHILKMLLRKRPDNICLEYLSDQEFGDILKNEIENEIRFCLQRN